MVQAQTITALRADTTCRKTITFTRGAKRFGSGCVRNFLLNGLKYLFVADKQLLSDYLLTHIPTAINALKMKLFKRFKRYIENLNLKGATNCINIIRKLKI